MTSEQAEPEEVYCDVCGRQTGGSWLCPTCMHQWLKEAEDDAQR